MFNGNRFSKTENFWVTYRQLGGNQLNEYQVKSIILKVYNRMEKDSENPQYCECFPPVKHHLLQVLNENFYSIDEIDLLDQVFMIHETGEIPKAYADTIRELSKTHRLIPVSNIWCRSALCLEQCRRAGIHDCFERTIFLRTMALANLRL